MPDDAPQAQGAPTPIDLRLGGLPETVLPPAPAAAAAALAEAVQRPAAERGEALAQVAARWPQMLQAWAELGRFAAGQCRHVDAYAYCRVGYHRGLDALRGAGWRGSGYVRWSAPSNHGFLASLQGLGLAAAAIGEDDEAQRCAMFLAQLDPSSAPTEPTGPAGPAGPTGESWPQP